MKGTAAIGCISDTYPQPLLLRSKFGSYAICVTGVIHNMDDLIKSYLEVTGAHFDAMTGGKVNGVELFAALMDHKDTFAEGIRYAQNLIEGTASVIILRDDGTIIAARDKFGRLPMQIGKRDDGFAVSFEDFAYLKLGFTPYRELGPGEIVQITPDAVIRLAEPGKKKRICSFLWSYYGYPTSEYEGVNVEVMRYRNGRLMARHDQEMGNNAGVDYVGGVPDSGTPHAIGYSNESGLPFARAFIKYTPTWARSFTPTDQSQRNRVAKMKQIPVQELIRHKSLLFVDDSIVRGTQLRETVEFLYESGAKEVHMRSACPPIMYGCKFLNFSRATSDLELIARRKILEIEGEKGFDHIAEYSDFNTERGKKLRAAICEELHLASLEFQSLEGIVEAIGLPKDQLCTYCWNGEE
jgi:amidophosphoribosyltransferase